MVLMIGGSEKVCETKWIDELEVLWKSERTKKGNECSGRLSLNNKKKLVKAYY